MNNTFYATRQHVTITDSDDSKYIGHIILQLHEGDEYWFHDGRKFKVANITELNSNEYYYYGVNGYWIRVRSNEVELF